MNKHGFSLVELLVVVGIIGILAMIVIPGYIGQQKRAARAEADTNLENLRLLEEQFYAENGAYTASIGVCAKDNPNNVGLIQAVLRGFRPGNATQYSYCLQQVNADLNGVAGSCFIARAYGNTGTRVDLDIFSIDCRNNRTIQ